MKGTELEYAAATHLLRSRTLTTSVMGHAIGGALDDEGRVIDWNAMLDLRMMLSDGERVLFELALTLWTGGSAEGDTRVAELLHWLDDDNFMLALDAIAIRSGRKPLSQVFERIGGE